MTAPKVIWVEPGMPGYTDEPCKGYTKRYTSADAPELVALVEEMKTFCRRVENGEVRSKRSYAAFKAAISAYEGMGK